MPDHHTNINIRETINSGQIFLWENYGNEWFVIDGDDIIMGKQTPFEVLTFSKMAKKFFREDDNYEKILKNITKDKIVKNATKRYPGLRVTRQDPFQCCISLLFHQIQIYQISECDFKNYVESLVLRLGLKKESFFFFLDPKCLQRLHCKIYKNVNWDIGQNMF